MYEITFEDFDRYYQCCDDFDWVDVPECGIVLFYNSKREFVAIDDGDKYYCKYKYWQIPVVIYESPWMKMVGFM